MAGTVRVLYFAALKDVVGLSEETLDLGGTEATVAEVARLLADRHPALEGRLSSVRFAVNETFSSNADRVRAGDTVALIPPVSGG